MLQGLGEEIAELFRVRTTYEHFQHYGLVGEKEIPVAGRRETPHGTTNGYNAYACRCDLCRSANRDAKRLAMRRKRSATALSKVVA
jgi:hypothetical protein